MNAYIKGIAIFKDATPDGKRKLELSRGLNIITGHSKTGKSAVLDIIDWCLGASESTIPKGAITDFAAMYAMLIDFKGKCFLLAREDGRKGKNYIHLKQVSENLTIHQVQLKDIDKNYFYKINEGLKLINEIINLNLGENKLIDIDFKIPQTDIRSALAYNFQHQNIISSNSRLFYIDPIKNHFPVLAGWFGSEYYIILSAIEKYQKSVKRLSIDAENAKKENDKLESNIIQSLHTYYNLIGIEFNGNWNVKQCIERINKLEDFKKQEYNNNLQIRQEEIDKIIGKKLAEQVQLNRQLSKIKAQQRHGSDYKVFLDKYNERSKLFDLQPEFTCPICSKHSEKLSLEALEILEATKWLEEELVNIPVHTSMFDKEEEELKSKINLINNEIAILKQEFKQNKIILDKIIKDKNLDEQKQKARWKAISDVEIYFDRRIVFNEKLLDEHRAQLQKYQEQKRTFNENERYEKAKLAIEERMSLIVEKLDFEHKPPELYFELNPNKEDSYKLFHNTLGDERVFLRRIGSASNGLACHIGLFLSFLNYFSSQKDSKVPSILFFDQPSQVYFPSGKDNTDIEKVAQIYETILNEIEEIERNTGFTPQIIVADHIKDLGEENIKLFEHYFKADWRNGKRFI